MHANTRGYCRYTRVCVCWGFLCTVPFKIIVVLDKGSLHILWRVQFHSLTFVTVLFVCICTCMYVHMYICIYHMYVCMHVCVWPLQLARLVFLFGNCKKRIFDFWLIMNNKSDVRQPPHLVAGLGRAQEWGAIVKALRSSDCDSCHASNGNRGLPAPVGCCAGKASHPALTGATGTDQLIIRAEPGWPVSWPAACAGCCPVASCGQETRKAFCSSSFCLARPKKGYLNERIPVYTHTHKHTKVTVKDYSVEL